MKNINAPHECTPSPKVLEDIKQDLLGRNRTAEEQKKLEAVTMQLERLQQYYAKTE